MVENQEKKNEDIEQSNSFANDKFSIDEYLKKKEKTPRYILFGCIALLAIVLVVTIITVFIVKGNNNKNNETTPDNNETTLTSKNSETTKEDSSTGSSTTIEDETTTVTETPIYPYRTKEKRTDYLLNNAYTYTSSVDTNIKSTSFLLVDLDSYNCIAGKNTDVKIYPASLTKLMTLLVACENITNLDDKVIISKEVIQYCYINDASVAGFDEGDIVTIKDLLYGIALPSGADAVLEMAKYICGSEDEFVKLMNKKAKDIGLTNTNFTNATGLHNENHYTTAREMAALFAYVMDNELCNTILSTKSYVTQLGYYKQNGEYSTYRMTFYSGLLVKRMEKVSPSQPNTCEVVAGKTGYTEEARHCIASYAKGPTKNYILVTFNASTAEISVNDYVYIYNKYLAQ